jgi:hypothetical protein
MIKLLLISVLAVAGCVSVPIPPAGDHVGELGYVKVSLKFQYLPAEPQTLDWFNPIVPQPKLYKDK